MTLVLLVLATFWVWETIRAFLRLAGRWYDYTRPGHPLAAAVFPLVVLWPDYITALAVAGAAGLLVALADRLFDSSPPVTLPTRGRRRGGLPPLP